MDGIRGWLLGVSFAALAGGIVYMLAPKGATEKSVRIAVSLFILVTALSPFIGGVDFTAGSFAEEPFPDGGALSDSLYDQISDNVAAAATVKVREVLEQYGLSGCGVEVRVASSGETFYAEKITVVSPGGYGGCEKAIRSEITEMTGTEDVALE